MGLLAWKIRSLFPSTDADVTAFVCHAAKNICNFLKRNSHKSSVTPVLSDGGKY